MTRDARRIGSDPAARAGRIVADNSKIEPTFLFVPPVSRGHPASAVASGTDLVLAVLDVRGKTRIVALAANLESASGADVDLALYRVLPSDITPGTWTARKAVQVTVTAPASLGTVVGRFDVERQVVVDHDALWLVAVMGHHADVVAAYASPVDGLPVAAWSAAGLSECPSVIESSDLTAGSRVPGAVGLTRTGGKVLA